LIFDPVFQSILLPITIGYFLFIWEFSEKKQKGRKNFTVPLKEILISVIALDFSVILPQLFSLEKEFSGDFQQILIYTSVFVMHFGLLLFYKKSSLLQGQYEFENLKKRKLSLVFNSYVGIVALVTNAVTMETIIHSSRWL
jgi:hypothetical protein